MSLRFAIIIHLARLIENTTAQGIRFIKPYSSSLGFRTSELRCCWNFDIWLTVNGISELLSLQNVASICIYKGVGIFSRLDIRDICWGCE